MKKKILIISVIVIAFVMVTIVGSLAYELYKYLHIEEVKKSGIGGSACFTYDKYPFGFNFQIVRTCFSIDKEKPTCDERTGWGGCGSIHSEYRDEDKIQDILDYCESLVPGQDVDLPYNSFSNSTHFIDNDTCKWVKKHIAISPFCSSEMILHLQKYSNYFNIYDEISFLYWIGLPEKMDLLDFEKCADTAIEAKTAWQMENPDYQNHEENLRYTLGSCYQSKNGLPHFAFGISYKNSTHHIDNRNCEWMTIDEYQIQRILNHCNADGFTSGIQLIYQDSDYYIDNTLCKWIKIDSEKMFQSGFQLEDDGKWSPPIKSQQSPPIYP